MNGSGTTIVDAQDASLTPGTDPLLHSKRAVDWFSILVTPLFGCPMLAMNLKRMNRSKGIMPVLSFGLSFSLFIYLATELVPIFPVFIWNGIGAVCIHDRLWNRYIGHILAFTKGPIWKPLIIVHLICGVLLLLWMYSAIY